MKEIYLLRFLLLLIISMPILGIIFYRNKQNSSSDDTNLNENFFTPIGLVILVFVFTYFFFVNDVFAKKIASLVAIIAGIFGISKDSYIVSLFSNKNKNK